MAEGLAGRSSEELDTLRAMLRPLFGELGSDELRAIVERMEPKALAGGERLMKQREAGDSLYVVTSGRLRAVVEEAGSPHVIGEISRGEAVGEMALLAGEQRSASIYAMRDTFLLQIPRPAFEELVAEHPRLLWNLSRLIVRRSQPRARVAQEGSARVSNVALLPTSPEVKLKEFGNRLKRALEPHGPTLALGRDDLPADLEPGTSGADRDPARLAAWLEDQERRHRFVLYRADPHESAWTRCCMRQADRILLLADATENPGPSWLRQAFRPPEQSIQEAARELVLLHRNGANLPRSTARWLALHPCVRHHQVRWDRNQDLARLARSLAGKAIGIVFAGGGARGFAHIGVVKALREAGIPLDLAGGTSMGAVVAAGVAIDWEQEELEENARRAFTAGKPLVDLNALPIVSFLRGERIDSRLRQFLGDTEIEDLWLPFLCVSSNLSQASPCIHRRGRLWKAIRASLAIPGVLPPVVYDNDLHVDGAVFDNLPVGEMRRLGAGRVVAVDLDIPRRHDLGYDTVPSPWAVMRNRMLPGGRRLAVPGIVSTIFQATVLSSRQRSKEALRQSDLSFNPEVRVGLMDWKSFDRVVGAGYRHAVERLSQGEAKALFE